MAPALVSAEVDVVQSCLVLLPVLDGFKDGRSLSSVVVPFTSE